MQTQSMSNTRQPVNNKRSGLTRAMRYLWNYKYLAAIPYLFLLIATLSQLMVPKLINNIINDITKGVIANTIVPKLNQIPPGLIPTILQKLGTTEEELLYYQANAVRLLIYAGIAIVLFAILRGIFAFLTSYWGERNSQSVAFDLRNELFAKIQRLSFSYHDRTQTGQLMIRATDDIEKVRLFIGQGLLFAVGALVLIVGTLIILFNTNARLTLIVLPILPLALILFMVFGSISQPLFTKVQIRLSALNTILQENLAGIKVVKAFTREKNEQAKFMKAANSLMSQQITVSRTFSFLFPLVFLIANLGQALVLYFGGRQIINNTLSIGEWQEFSLYLDLPFSASGPTGIDYYTDVAGFGLCYTYL